MIQLTMTEKQAKTISQALEFYERIHMGQLEDILELAPELKKDCTLEEKEAWLKKRDRLRDKLPELRRIFTGLDHPNASFGIMSHEISDNARIAYDLHQVIRHYLFRRRNPDPKGSERFMVDNDTPRKTSQELLASISSVG